MQILASSRRISGSSLPGNSVRYAVENDRKHDDLYVGTIEYPIRWQGAQIRGSALLAKLCAPKAPADGIRLHGQYGGTEGRS